MGGSLPGGAAGPFRRESSGTNHDGGVMTISKRAIIVAAATSLTAFLVGCENVVTMSTADSAAKIAGLRDAAASEANTDLARDAIVAARLTDALRHDPTTKSAEIYVSVSNGHARLSGFVDTAATRLRAGVLASRTEGVDAVDNRLILRYRADISQDPIGDARVHL